MKPNRKIKEGSIWKPGLTNSIPVVVGGILLTIIGSFFNWQIEKSKIKNSFISEFNKIKAQKIGETWEALNVYEAKADMILKLSKQFNDDLGKNPKHDERNYKKLTGLINEALSDSIYYITQKNRFWIGDEQYKLMGDFVTLIYRKQEIYKHFSTDSLIIFDNLINNKRGQIDSVLNKMLK